ncbi:MAG: hypothetical protein AB1481_03370 [Candidatus Omnitrophota bacterium]
MEAIKDTVYHVIESWQKKQRGPGPSDPEMAFTKLLTKKELAHIKFKYFKKGVIGFNVDSSSWLYKLALQKEGLILKASKECPSIKNVRFVIGDVK